MWVKTKKWFLYSETIFLARLTMMIGCMLEVLAQMEPSMFSGVFGKWFPFFLIFHGFLNEYLRKRRDAPLKERGR